MILGNKRLLCDCENSLIARAPYCDDCFHKDPSIRFNPFVSLKPTIVLKYMTDPSNTYIGTNKVYEFPQKKYNMLPKQITKNNNSQFNDPNTIYEKQYYNPTYLQLKYNEIDPNNNKNEYFNSISSSNNNIINNNIIIIIIAILLLLGWNI